MANVSTFIDNELAAYGLSMTIQEKARLMTIKQLVDQRTVAAIELIQKARSLNGAYGADAHLQDALIALETLTAGDAGIK